jgi:undecaprenyl-diphosphatase
MKKIWMGGIILGLWIKGVNAESSGLTEWSVKHTVALGIVQGITEFLPVSSTGHMLLLNGFFFKTSELPRSLKTYVVCIQLGTIVVLGWAYGREIKRIIRGIVGRDPLGFRLGMNLCLAFIPAGLCGFFWSDWIHQHLYQKGPIIWALVGGSVLIFITDRLNPRPLTQTGNDVFAVPTWTAWKIGMWQVLALCPGLSRSLITILAGLWLGLSLLQSVHFSFLLGCLTSSVSVGYEILSRGGEMANGGAIGPILAGMGVAMACGFVTIRGFLWFLQTHSLKIFAYYRLILAGIIWIGTI